MCRQTTIVVKERILPNQEVQGRDKGDQLFSGCTEVGCSTLHWGGGGIERGQVTMRALGKAQQRDHDKIISLYILL